MTHEILIGDCLDVMKTFPDNHFSGIVCDPPYFLTNNSGSGFMGKSWDSIHDLPEYVWKNKEFVCFAINFFQSLRIENYTGEESTVLEDVSTNQQKEEKNLEENVKIVERHLRSRNALKKDFAPLLVITKQEARELLKELSPNHITLIDQFMNGEKEDVKYAIPTSFLRKEVNCVARKNVLPSLKVECSGAKEILLTLTDLQRIKSAIAGIIGTKSENQFTSVTNGNADIAEFTAKESKFNVIISSHIKREELTQWITSLLCAINAIRSSNTIPNYLIGLFFKTAFSEAIRILKPGSYVLAFGGTRSSHKLAMALEQSGFSIIDSIYWCYGSGFPKSHNHFGIEGFGTALKPAIEPCILAMKPFDGTFKQNAEKWGVAGINIDGCRIDYRNKDDEKHGQSSRGSKTIQNLYEGGFNSLDRSDRSHIKGRWPANLILDSQAAAMLDEQSGVSKSPQGSTNRAYGTYKMRDGMNHRPCHDTEEKRESMSGFGDSGGASRFFYCAKTSPRERNEGLGDFEPQSNMRVNGPRESEDQKFATKVKNNHPTVKPLALMRYLLTLIAPPQNALILDPFAGSGSTVLAAKQLGISCIGIEKSTEYAEIARARVANGELLEKTEQLEMAI